MRHVAAIPAVGLLAGAAFGLLGPELPHLPSFTFLIACGGLSVWAWRAAGERVLAAAVVAGFFAGGAMLAADAWQRAWRPPLRLAFEEAARAGRAHAPSEARRMPEDDEAFMVVEGVLRADAAPTASGVSLSVLVDGLEGRDRPARWSAKALAERDERSAGERTSGGILVTVVGSLAAERMDAWRAGRRVRMPIMLHRPSRYLDPAVPDHERALARRGTTLVGTVKSGALVEVMERGSALDEAMGAARAFARRAIADGVGRWSPRSAAIVAAIVIGDRAGLDPDVQRRLQEAGTYHVIAISGGNIAILAGLLIAAFRITGWLGRTAMLSAIVVLLTYSRLVGAGASVDRATLMAVVYFGARTVDQRTPPLNALAVVAAALVASDPLSVADPAFMLTCGATLAILAVVPVVAGTIHHESTKDHEVHEAFGAKRVFVRLRDLSWLREWTSSIRRPVIAMFAASVAAEALLFPVGALAFSRVTFAGLVLNFLAIPLMGLAQVAGMAVVPLSAVSTAAAAVAGWMAHVGAAGLVWSADLVRFTPALTYRLAPPSWIPIACYYAAVLGWWTLWCRRRRLGSGTRGSVRWAERTAAGLAVMAASWILVDPASLVARRGDGTLHLTFLDVGQGDAIFIVFPRGATMLVDAGGLSSSSAFDIGDRVVAPVIRDAGFRRIDYLVLTHGDPDHIGGATAIVREFRPREVWEGIPVPRFEPLARLRVAVEQAGARWARVHAGEGVAIDAVEVAVRHPSIEDWERQKVRNDDSIVLELRWRDVSVLLTGDIGRGPEHIIAPTLKPARLRLVKVPHHGSLTSSSADFVRATHPQIAVVSAGRSNHFGHPVPEVLERYRAAGAEVFRTDRDGAVTLRTDGHSIDVRTFNGRRLSLR